MTAKVMTALISIVAGVGGALVLYYLLNKLAERLPGRWEDRIKPYVYILPAVAAIGLFLIYPAYQTIVYSFANRTSTEWVGLDN
jgi:alpha-glucoside transport system permease protein